MARKRDGFVPLGDVAGGVELPGGRALTPAVPRRCTTSPVSTRSINLSKPAKPTPISASWRGC